MARQRLQHAEVEGIAPVPAANRAGRQPEAGIADHTRRVEILAHAQAVARRTGAGRIVEREQARFEFGDRVAALRAGVARREQMLLNLRLRVIFERHRYSAYHALAERERGFEGFRQALRLVLAHHHAIHHRFDGVLDVFFQHRRFVQLNHLAVDARPHVALGAQVFENLHMLALAVRHHRREQHQARALRQADHVIHHLAHGLGGERDAVIRAARFADARVQQAQVVVDFGYRADRRARVVRGGFLFNRDRR